MHRDQALGDAPQVLLHPGIQLVQVTSFQAKTPKQVPTALGVRSRGSRETIWFRAFGRFLGKGRHGSRYSSQSTQRRGVLGGSLEFRVVVMIVSSLGLCAM